MVAAVLLIMAKLDTILESNERTLQMFNTYWTTVKKQCGSYIKVYVLFFDNSPIFDDFSILQSWTKYLRQTLTYM